MYTIYSGPSMIDGAPIIVVATGIDAPSHNKKTGALVQTWIMRSDVPPVTSIKTGDDRSVCGDCPHRGTSCYVHVGHGPRSVFEAYHRGKYPEADPIEVGAHRFIRVGSWGDPFAAPYKVWTDLLRKSAGNTGYSHLLKRFPDAPKICQASADSAEEALQYQAQGFKTFRVKTPDEPMLPGEIYCPSERGVQCITCGLCNGRKANVAINVHGTVGKIKQFHLRVVDTTSQPR